MNDALNFYENEKKVWNITGFQFPISYQELPNAFFSYFSSCWSWGTWIDRWRSYDKNPDKYISLLSKKERYKFDYYGSAQRYSQIIGNKTGKINTWAIFWYAEMFINKGLCLFPAEPLAKNIGMDGSGIHCGSTSIYDCNVCKVELEIDFNKIPIEENRLAIELICRFNRKQKQNIINRIVQKGCRKMMKLKKLGINWFISLKNKIQMNCRIK